MQSLSAATIPGSGVASPDTLPADHRGVRPRKLAKLLDVAPNVIYGAIYSGEMKVWKFGRAIVIPADEVDRWLASKQA